MDERTIRSEVGGIHPEKRKSPRIPIHMEVTYRAGVQERTETYKAASLNLSQEGIFVQIALPLAMETEVELRFRLPGTSQDLSVRGRVVWVRNREGADRELPGKGIEFVDMDQETRRILRSYFDGEIRNQPRRDGARA